jgi:hypothetical protein
MTSYRRLAFHGANLVGPAIEDTLKPYNESALAKNLTLVSIPSVCKLYPQSYSFDLMIRTEDVVGQARFRCICSGDSQGALRLCLLLIPLLLLVI